MDDKPRPGRWLTIGALVALTIVYQLKVLEPTPEHQEEIRYANLSALPAGSALLTYIGTLLSGPLRGLAITWLWMEYDELAYNQRRYMEAVTYLKLILKLNPRNPEVWATLGNDLCYNLQSVAPPSQQWPLYKEGLLVLREGVEAIPTSGYLAHELGWKMLHKVSWEPGRFTEGIIDHVTNDDELQAALSPDGTWDGQRRTPFMLAKPWFRYARDKLDEEMTRKQREAIYTQMGLLMSPSLMDMYIMYCDYRQAMYEWYPPRRRHDAALAHLRDAMDQVGVISKRYGDWISIIYERRSDMYKLIEDILRFEAAAPKEPGPQDPPEARAAYVEHLSQSLRRMETLLTEFETLDEGYVYTRAQDLKRRLTRDSGELDDFPFCARFLGVPKDQPVELPANLSPAGSDLDVFLLILPPVAPDAPSKTPDPVPSSVEVFNGAGVPIHVRVVAFAQGRFEPLSEAVVQPREMQGFSEIMLDYKKTTFLMVSPARLPEGGSDPLPYLVRRLK